MSVHAVSLDAPGRPRAKEREQKKGVDPASVGSTFDTGTYLIEGNDERRSTVLEQIKRLDSLWFKPMLQKA
jgi:hypothetical protein